MRFALLLLCAGLTACGPRFPASSLTADRQDSGPFLADTAGLDRSAKLSLAAAELQVLQFGQPGQPVNWSLNLAQSGQVSASQPFRVSGRECRRLTYQWSGKGAVSTVCRNDENFWVSVG
jgi:surface antigen